MPPVRHCGWTVRSAGLGLLALVVVALSSPQLGLEAQEPPTPATVNPEHPLAPALEQAYKAREALAAVKDYEAYFEKREFVERRLVTSKINLKVREQPFSVYLGFIEPNAGREVIYVEGQNEGMLLAHDVGIKALAGTVSRAPNSKDAMDGNRYPVTMIGVRKMLEQVIAQWEQEAKFSETDVKYYPNAKLGDVEVKAIQSTHPQPRKQFRFHMTRLYLDKQTNLPVRVEQFGFPTAGEKTPPVVEEYTYSRLKANIGLTERDFDTKNPSYAFP
jgi:hypothetical protein